MKSILNIFALIVSLVSAEESENRLLADSVNRPAYCKETSPVLMQTKSFTCPKQTYISQINSNIGAVLDRINIRCNDPNYSRFGDIGTPIGYVTSPKASTIRLPRTPKVAKGWDSVNVGYQYYAPYDREVVASIQFCANGLCTETGFFYGLTICSADSTQPYQCNRISSFSADSGKYLTSITASYLPHKCSGYVTEFTPKFA